MEYVDVWKRETNGKSTSFKTKDCIEKEHVIKSEFVCNPLIDAMKAASVCIDHEHLFKVEQTIKPIMEAHPVDKATVISLAQNARRIARYLKFVIANKQDILCKLRQTTNDDGIILDKKYHSDLRCIMEKFNQLASLDEYLKTMSIQNYDQLKLEEFRREVSRTIASLKIGESCLTRIESLIERKNDISCAEKSKSFPWRLSSLA